jgi:hypothetical protein
LTTSSGLAPPSSAIGGDFGRAAREASQNAVHCGTVGDFFWKVPTGDMLEIRDTLKAWTAAGERMLRLMGTPEASQDEHGEGDAPAGVRA